MQHIQIIQAQWRGLELGFLGKLAVMVLGLSFFTPAFSGSNFVAVPGNLLFKLCTSDDEKDLSSCDGYILGVLDSIYSGHLQDYFDLCFPPGINVVQMRLMIKKYMEKNPEQLNFAAEGFVAKAMELAFACPTEK